MVNLLEAVALVPKLTEAANFDLEEERTEGHTVAAAAATPQLINELAAILDEEWEVGLVENGLGMNKNVGVERYKYMGTKDIGKSKCWLLLAKDVGIYHVIGPRVCCSTNEMLMWSIEWIL